MWLARNQSADEWPDQRSICVGTAVVLLSRA
jgi:hypothetical protein